MPERRVNQEGLQSFTKTIFERAGMPPDDAAIEAEVLVWANLRGVDSHGVQRVDGYVHAIDNGYMNPFATFITCSTGDFNYTCLAEDFIIQRLAG